MKSPQSEPSVSLLKGLTIGYRGRKLTGSKETSLASADEDIRLETGRHLLLARNGRGKTTLLKTVANIIPALKGKIECDGTDIGDR